MSVIIAASRWPLRWPIDRVAIDGPTDRSGGEDAVNGGLAEAGEQVYSVLDQVGRDSCPHALARPRVMMTRSLSICPVSSGDMSTVYAGLPAARDERRDGLGQFLGHLGVDVHRERDRRMAKHLADHLRLDPGGQTGREQCFNPANRSARRTDGRGICPGRCAFRLCLLHHAAIRCNRTGCIIVRLGASGR
jgi:hypothetical protein